VHAPSVGDRAPADEPESVLLADAVHGHRVDHVLHRTARPSFGFVGGLGVGGPFGAAVPRGPPPKRQDRPVSGTRRHRQIFMPTRTRPPHAPRTADRRDRRSGVPLNTVGGPSGTIRRAPRGRPGHIIEQPLAVTLEESRRLRSPLGTGRRERWTGGARKSRGVPSASALLSNPFRSGRDFGEDDHLRSPVGGLHACPGWPPSKSSLQPSQPWLHLHCGDAVLVFGSSCPRLAPRGG